MSSIILDLFGSQLSESSEVLIDLSSVSDTTLIDSEDNECTHNSEDNDQEHDSEDNDQEHDSEDNDQEHDSEEGSQASEASVDPESLEQEEEPTGESLNQDDESCSLDEESAGSLVDFIVDDLSQKNNVIDLTEDSEDEQPAKKRRL